MATILIVEDDQRTSSKLCDVLHSRGYETRVEINGASALLAAHEMLPDLILIDLTVPILDGQEVIQALRHDPRTARIPVVVLSARDDDRQIADALVAGANIFYCTRPLDPAVLISIVERLLTLHVKDTA